MTQYQAQADPVTPLLFQVIVTEAGIRWPGYISNGALTGGEPIKFAAAADICRRSGKEKGASSYSTVNGHVALLTLTAKSESFDASRAQITKIPGSSKKSYDHARRSILPDSPRTCVRRGSRTSRRARSRRGRRCRRSGGSSWSSSSRSRRQTPLARREVLRTFGETSLFLTLSYPRHA